MMEKKFLEKENYLGREEHDFDYRSLREHNAKYHCIIYQEQVEYSFNAFENV